MRRAYLLAILLSLCSQIDAALPNISFLQSISTGDADVLPGGIVANGTDLFIAGFAQRRVLKVSGAHTQAPAVSVLYRSSTQDAPPGPISWDLNEGLVTVDFASPNLLLVAGDTFDDGIMMVIDANTGEVIQRQAPNLREGSGLRIASAAFYGSKRILAGYTAGSNYFEFNLDLTGPVFYNGPNPPFSRDLQVGNGNTLYVGFNTAEGVIGIHRWVDDTASPGSVAGNVATPSWFSTKVSNSRQTVNGLGRLEHGGIEYLILTDPGGARLLFVDAQNPANPMEFRDPNITQPRDVTVMSGVNGKFLAVTQSGGGRVTIFGIDGAQLMP